ncbi:CsgG/HfaB family protein [Spirochaetota bacterium]
MKVISSLVFLIVLSILVSSPTYSAKKMILAVMDFKAEGVSKRVAKNTSELIRTEMINTGKYRVVERKQINQILKEQGFQKTGCTDQQCAVKIGKLLSAKYILIGTIMKYEGNIVINGRIVDVEKGIALFGQRQLTKKGKLFSAVTLFTDKLTAKITKERKTVKRDYKRVEPKKEYDISSHKDYVSPGGAGITSLLPFWSGSFNKGFDGWGLTLAILKSSSFAFIFICIQQSNKNEDLANKTSSEEDWEYYNNKKDRWKIGLIASGITCISLCVIDIFYSVIVVSNYNSKLIRPISAIDIPKEISLDIKPRYDYNSEKVFSPDGIDLSVSMKF